MGQLFHPYINADGGVWLRGSFHGHCSESSRCASVSLHESVKWYRRAGADFVALTDHDVVTCLAEMRETYPELIMLEGFEYSSCENLLFVGEHVEALYQLPLGEALRRRDAGVLTVVCHPDPHAEGPEYWTLAKLADLGSWPDGIEVYNGHYGTPTARAHGRQPLGTQLWDEALSHGHRQWGYANDDSHDPEDLGNAWNMVYALRRSAAAVVQAARAGRCYGTTGLLLQQFRLDEDRMHIELDAPARGAFIGPGGTVLAESTGAAFDYRVGAEEYVRFQAHGEGGRIFLQPAFRQ